MPLVANPDDGVRTYFEVIGRGTPIAFVHGLTLSSRSWHDCGYVAALEERHQLILIDARGHGRSDKPHDSSLYSERQRVSDVLAVLNACGVESVVFCGYSMGVKYGYLLALLAPERARGLIAIGSGFGGRTRPEDPVLRFESGMQAFIDRVELEDEPVPPELRSAMLANDAQALQALTRGLTPASDRTAELARLTVPVLVVAGAHDGNYDEIIRAAEALRDAELVIIDAIGHLGSLTQRQLVLPHVEKFLERIQAEQR